MDREQIERLWGDKANWTWRIIYHCREDPRAIVPRRWRWGGWTLNFSHPKTGFVGLGVMALAVGPALLTLYLFSNRTAVFAAMAFSFVALISVAHWESSRTR